MDRYCRVCGVLLSRANWRFHRQIQGHYICHDCDNEQGNERTKKAHHKMRLNVLQYLGMKCVVCGITDWRVLQVNHKNGGGMIDVRTNGAYKIFSEILSGKRPKEDYDVRCANHNILFEYERGRYNDYGEPRK